MAVWFTSDNHFYHKNVISYCNRPFASLEEMHETMIARWNEVVKEDDYVYIVGDFAFCSIEKARAILERLNGFKVLVRGNHDGSETRMYKVGFDDVVESVTLYTYGVKLEVSHYPYAPTARDEFIHKLKNFWKFWRKKKYTALRFMDRRLPDNGRWLIHGHVHCAWKIKRKMINVGVDVWDFRPVPLSKIIAIIAERGV